MTPAATLAHVVAVGVTTVDATRAHFGCSLSLARSMLLTLARDGRIVSAKVRTDRHRTGLGVYAMPGTSAEAMRVYALGVGGGASRFNLVSAKARAAGMAMKR